MSDRRPNLLLITSDQQRWDSLSVYGEPGYHTPNLDRLATEGVLFERSYCPSPVCTPARVSMLTGQYPTRHGAYQIGMEPVPALQGPTVASELTAAGYGTALIGKTHFVARHLEAKHVAGDPHPDPDAPDPSDEFWHHHDGPYVGFQFVRHCQSHTCDRPPNAHYRAWLQKQGLDLDHQHDLFDGKNRTKVIEDGLWQKDPEHTQNAWITDESLQWIERQHADRPWFCWASYQDPHPPYVCPDPYFSQVDMEGVDPGGLREGEMDDKPPLIRRYFEGHYWSDEDKGEFLDPDCPSKNIPAHRPYDRLEAPLTAIQAYIGMVNMLDDYVGRLLDGLRALGELENTLILFTTDHGDMLGRHGLWGKGIAAYDDCQRVPVAARWPAGQNGAIGRSPSMFNLVDVMPTLLDAAGVEPPPFMQGVSQLPAITGEREVVRDWALVDYRATPTLHQQTLIHDGHKLVTYRHADYGELYDLERDPDQYENLFDDPAARPVRERLMHRLVRANMAVSGKMPRRIWNA
ncbi:MAG: sulfatase-like hydrolase/transferase [Candidatus Brocadiia bacterium]